MNKNEKIVTLTNETVSWFLCLKLLSNSKKMCAMVLFISGFLKYIFIIYERVLDEKL